MASWTAAQSGNWSTAATWGGSGIPADGDSVTIPSGITVTFDADHSAFTSGLAGLTLNGTLAFPTSGNNATNSCPWFLLAMASAVNITGSGNLTIGSSSTPIPKPAVVQTTLSTAITTGNSTPNVVVTSATNFVAGKKIYLYDSTNGHIDSLTISSISLNTIVCTANVQKTYTTSAIVLQQQMPSLTIKWIGSTGVINVTGTVSCYGWIPTTPAAHPDYTTLSANAANGSNVVTLNDDMGFQAGDQIMISAQCENLDTNSNQYTVVKYTSATKTAIIFPALAADTNGSYTTRYGAALNSITDFSAIDYVARYSRPIYITHTVGGGSGWTLDYNNVVVNGTLFYRTAVTSYNSSGHIVKGCTFDDGGQGITQSAAGAQQVFDCTMFCKALQTPVINSAEGGVLIIAIGCFGLNTAMFRPNGGNIVNCIATVCSALTWSSGVGVAKIVNCVASYSYLAACLDGGIISNCYTNGGGPSIDLGAAGTTFPSRSATIMEIYGFKSNAMLPIRGHAMPCNPVNRITRFLDRDNVVGKREFYCSGGWGTTDPTLIAAATNNTGKIWGANYETMMFQIDGVNTNTPLWWDTLLHLNPNNALSLTAYIYALTNSGVSAQLWIIDPKNDPLDFNWQTGSPLPTMTVGTAPGQVLASAAMAAPNSAWQSVSIATPSYTTFKDLLCRVIVTGTKAAMCCVGLDLIDAATSIQPHKRKIIL